MKLFFLALGIAATAVFLPKGDQKFVEVADRSGLTLLNPDFAERKTCKIRLHNDMEWLFISDPKASSSAVAVTVNVGSWHDPVEFQGMAHFCEHMLFMGTEKYPDENAFIAKVTDQGGATNAMTTSDRTVYMFSSNPEGFSDLLDQFAHFFIDPLFNPSNISREMHAVDQEFAKNREHDGFRLSMIFKELCNAVHPHRVFGCGNSETLSRIPQSALKKWHQEHYSANRMRGVIYSSLSLDALKEMVSCTFSEVPTASLSSRIDPSLPITSSKQKGAITYIQPIQDQQSCVFLWELPPTLSLDSTRSANLIAYALNRGQKYSLYEALKEELLIENLDVQVFEMGGTSHKFFEISMDLTKKGIQQLDQVGLKVFQTLSLIQSTGIPHYLFQEKNHLAQMHYEYQSREEAFSYVTRLALGLPDESLETYPKNQLLGAAYSPKMISDVVSMLTPDQCVFFVLGSPNLTGVAPDSAEKWVGAKYALRPLPAAWLHAFSEVSPASQIRLPEPNPFAPANLSLVSEQSPSDMPLLLSQTENGIAYFARCPEYKTPEVSIRLHLLSSELNSSPMSQVLGEIFCGHFNDALHSLFKAALDANLKASIQPDRCRIQMKIDGFSEKATLLLQEILHQLPLNPPTLEQFNQRVAFLEKQFANGQKELAFRQAKDLLDALIYQDKVSKNEKLAVLQSIQYEDYLTFQKNLLEKTYIEAFFGGNLTQKQAESAWLDVIHVLGKTPFLKKDHPITKAANLPKGPYYIHQTTKSLGNATLLSLDLGPFTFQKRAIQEILSTALREAFFNELRTKQKTGYFTMGDAQEIEGRLYLLFAVQSNSHQPEDLLYRYELFLEEFVGNLTEHISEKRFLTLQENVAMLLQSRICNLKEKIDLFDLLAFHYGADFQFLEKRISAIRDLHYEEFCETAVQFLSRDNRERLAILFEGQLASPFIYEPITPTQLSEIAIYTDRELKMNR